MQRVQQQFNCIENASSTAALCFNSHTNFGTRYKAHTSRLSSKTEADASVIYIYLKIQYGLEPISFMSLKHIFFHNINWFS